MKERLFAPFPQAHPVMNTPAVWHPSPDCSRDGFSVVLFRRSFQLSTSIRNAVLWVTACQRFELFLDGKRVARGPSRSDPWRWPVVRVPVRKLPAGPHVLSARVTHFGEFGGEGQMGGSGFFLVCGEGALAEWVNTGEAWKCHHDRSRRGGIPAAWGTRRFTYTVGMGETVVGAEACWGWEQPRFAERGWLPARVVCRRAADPWGNIFLEHVLRPDPLPQMEEARVCFARVAEVSGVSEQEAAAWVKGAGCLRIPSRSRVRLLLDTFNLTNAYPVLTVSRGAGSRIRVVSAESPFTGTGHSKGNRDETRGKKIWGQQDVFLPDGGIHRVFSTLWFRAFRYLELTIRTSAQPLVLEGVHACFTGFPMRQAARFQATGKVGDMLERFWDVSWRTARLCAHETFFDCPHYEQMQFPGDTRVQAVLQYLVAGEDRLARKAIDDFAASRSPLGLTLCKYPSKAMQTLATYGLYWIGMLHDFRVYRGDAAFLGAYLDGAREVLATFRKCVRPDGLLGRVDYAPFMDWAHSFECGNAPQEPDGGSSLLTLLFAQSCRWMSGLEAFCGFPELAARWDREAAALAAATRRACWDSRRGLLADTDRRQQFSVHGQVEAILAGAFNQTQARRSLLAAMADPGVTQPGTFYYRYYVMQALKQVGIARRFFDLLDPWRTCLEGTGLRTWPEGSSGTPRSDCHAWSVSPAIECLQTVLGVEPDPACSGFTQGVFRPVLGALPQASGRVPTPQGNVDLALERVERGRVRARIATPIPLQVLRPQRLLRPGRHDLIVNEVS